MSNNKNVSSEKITISSVLDNMDLSVEVSSVGKVTSFGDGVIKASGLDDAQAGELIDIGNGERGLILNLEKGNVGIVALDDARELKVGDTLRRTGKILSTGVGDGVLGRVVDALGKPIDGKGDFSVDKEMPLEKVAPGVMSRQSVSVPLQTGVKAIDAMIPVGRGQRELIIGDRSTGKTSIALGTILNQKNQDMVCVYVCIGQKNASLAQTKQILEQKGAMDYTVIVGATASKAASQQFLAPYTGLAIAEYFLEKGRDVLIIYDDLSKHAQAYREVSLLLRRPSGREAYPGDVFYLHSRLLERACRLNKKHGGELARAKNCILTKDLLQKLEQEADILQKEMVDDWHSKFLLPGGSELAANLDIARTVCRRSERRLVEYGQDYEVRPLLLKSLNRLSDYLYVLRCNYMLISQNLKPIKKSIELETHIHLSLYQ